MDEFQMSHVEDFKVKSELQALLLDALVMTFLPVLGLLHSLLLFLTACCSLTVCLSVLCPITVLLSVCVSMQCVCKQGYCWSNALLLYPHYHL